MCSTLIVIYKFPLDIIYKQILLVYIKPNVKKYIMPLYVCIYNYAFANCNIMLVCGRSKCQGTYINIHIFFQQNSISFAASLRKSHTCYI